MLRKFLFWCHLFCGVVVGLVVLMMASTGVILTYERQLLSLADTTYYRDTPLDAQPLSIDTLLRAAEKIPDFEPTSITVSAQPEAPVQFRAGRSQRYYVNPYTAEVYPPRDNSLDKFFTTLKSWHRWFNRTGEQRSWGRAITGASNLVFFFLIVSGLYLWLPRIYRWTAFKMRLWFRANPDSAARDFNWHHVLGIWAAIPLLVIVPTATVFNYSWANDWVYRLAGEAPPVRGGRQSEPGPDNPYSGEKNYQRYLQTAAAYREGWQTITLSITGTVEVPISIDFGNGGQPQKRHSLIADAATSDIISSTPFADLSRGRQARSWIRFLHTGEALGIVGQTIAGLASLAAAIMVWTGLSLALHRLRRFWAQRRHRKIKAMSDSPINSASADTG